MFKSKISIILIIILAAGAVSFMGCGSDDSETPPPTDAEKFDNSIISIPESLTGDVSTSKSFKTLKAEGDESEGMEGIYSGIRHYVAMAEMFKEMAKEMMINIAESGMLESATQGQEYDISDDSDPEGPQRLVLEADDSGNYEWKLSLFFTETGSDPELIVRFTLTDSGAKGRILMEMTEEENGVDITRQLDLTFDGTTSTKTLDIKLIQDLDELYAYANDHWGTLEDDEKEALDVGQPEKVFCNASYDGVEFTIYGTSYHPGWEIEADLEGDATFWGDDRTMYMFKAKAIEGAVEGAKFYLALPLDTTTDITNVWTEDSVGEIFTDIMLAQINDYLAAQSAGDRDNLLKVILDVDTVPAGKTSITEEELVAFVNSTQTNEDIIEFQNMYKSISYMINPAFYDAASGFLGTYDETNDIFYNYTGTGMEAGTPPSSFTVLNALDLSAINPHVPADVVEATITVE